MKAFLAAVTLAGMLAATTPVMAAEPSPSPAPKSLPIRGVTVDVQKMDQAPGSSGASHIEAPPLRMFRMAPSSANEMAAPAPAAEQRLAAPAAARAKAAPGPSPSPSPSPRSR